METLAAYNIRVREMNKDRRLRKVAPSQSEKGAHTRWRPPRESYSQHGSTRALNIGQMPSYKSARETPAGVLPPSKVFASFPVFDEVLESILRTEAQADKLSDTANHLRSNASTVWGRAPQSHPRPKPPPRRPKSVADPLEPSMRPPPSCAGVFVYKIRKANATIAPLGRRTCPNPPARPTQHPGVRSVRRHSAATPKRTHGSRSAHRSPQAGGGAS